MNYKFSYAIYGKDFQQPLIRFDNEEDANNYLFSYHDGVIVVEEVCEYDDNQRLIIKKERIREAPMIWFPTTFIPAYDGHFLCYISVKEECGAVNNKLEMVWCHLGCWNVLPNQTVIKWMIVKEPISNNSNDHYTHK